MNDEANVGIMLSDRIDNAWDALDLHQGMLLKLQKRIDELEAAIDKLQAGLDMVRDRERPVRISVTTEPEAEPKYGLPRSWACSCWKGEQLHHWKVERCFMCGVARPRLEGER